MAILRAKNAVILAKVETTEGVDAVPVAGSNAILVENMQINLTPQVQETNEYVGSLDGLDDIVGGLQVGMSFDAHVKGSGTPGTIPELDPVIRACGFSQLATATAVPAAPEACGAGGSTFTAQLGASAGSTAQQYRGMPITFSGEVAGPSFITDYTGGKIATLADLFASIDADTSYQIPINNLYAPITSPIPSLTIEVFWDGIKYSFLAGRGDLSMRGRAGQSGMFSFNFNAMFNTKSDAAVPSTDAYQSVRPPIYKGGVAKLNRLAAAISEFNLQSGMRMVFPDDPNAQEGFGAPQHVGRKMKLSLDPQMTLVATADPFADMRAGTKRIFHGRWGTVAGNRVGITVPQFQVLRAGPAERNGILVERIEGNAVGENSGAFICFY